MIKRKNKERPEFNTTALPDIIFMLLFFFMVVTVIRETEEQTSIKIPTVEYANDLKNHKNYINLSIENQQGAAQLLYYINKKKYHSIDNFKQVLNGYLKGIVKSDIKVKLKVDKHVQLKYLNEMKAVLIEAELYNVEYILNKGTL